MRRCSTPTVLFIPPGRRFGCPISPGRSNVSADSAHANSTKATPPLESFRSIQAGGGVLTADDLASARAVVRPALETPVADWRIANQPAAGHRRCDFDGPCSSSSSAPASADWNDAAVAELVDIYRAVLGFRRDHLDFSRDLARDTEALLDRVRSDALRESGATVHTSAVDAAGLACSITMSSGYGSGEMPDETGLWLNNCLGEIDLNRLGLDAGPPGTRLISNMAPTIARSDATTIAIGSPGASRITSALCQTLVNHLVLGKDLEAAIDAPAHSPRIRRRRRTHCLRARARGRQNRDRRQARHPQYVFRRCGRRGRRSAGPVYRRRRPAPGRRHADLLIARIVCG